MSTPQSRQPLRQIARHLCRRRRRARRDCGEGGGDGEQVLDPMTYLCREHLARFLGLFAGSDVEEDPEHDPAGDAVVGALPSSGNLPDLIAVHKRKSIS